MLGLISWGTCMLKLKFTLIALGFFIVGSSAWASPFCASFFQTPEQNIKNVYSNNVQRAIKMRDIIYGLKASNLLQGDQTRLSSYIIEQLKIGAGEAVAATLKARTLSEMDAAATFARKIEIALEAALLNETSNQATTIQVFANALKREDFENQRRTASEILDRPISKELFSYIEALSLKNEIPLNKILEKWIQLRYQFKKNYSSLEVSDAMMFLLTTIALNDGRSARVAQSYAYSKYEIYQAYGVITESMEAILLFNKMDEFVKIRPIEDIDLYNQLKKDLSQSSPVPLALPAPQ